MSHFIASIFNHKCSSFYCSMRGVLLFVKPIDFSRKKEYNFIPKHYISIYLFALGNIFFWKSHTIRCLSMLHKWEKSTNDKRQWRNPTHKHYTENCVCVVAVQQHKADYNNSNQPMTMTKVYIGSIHCTNQSKNFCIRHLKDDFFFGIYKHPRFRDTDILFVFCHSHSVSPSFFLSFSVRFVALSDTHTYNSKMFCISLKAICIGIYVQYTMTEFDEKFISFFFSVAYK